MQRGGPGRTAVGQTLRLVQTPLTFFASRHPLTAAQPSSLEPQPRTRHRQKPFLYLVPEMGAQTKRLHRLLALWSLTFGLCWLPAVTLVVLAGQKLLLNGTVSGDPGLFLSCAKYWLGQLMNT